MKRLIMFLLLSVLLTGCTGSNSMPKQLSAKMMSEDTQTSLIYSFLGDKDFLITSPEADDNYLKNTHKRKLYFDENYYNERLNNFEEFDRFACSTREEFDEDFDNFYSRYEELKTSYRDLLSKLENPVEDAKINDQVIIGIEVIENGNRNTAYLYSNNVMKFTVDDQVEYYLLNGDQAGEWAKVLFEYEEYYLKEETVPCWQKYK